MSEDIHVDNRSFPLNESLCLNCINRMSLIMIPLEPEAYGIDDTFIDALDVPEGEEIYVEQHTCLKLNQDMDFVVVACNHFKQKKDNELLKSEPY